jgi:hypothetical protein
MKIDVLQRGRMRMVWACEASTMATNARLLSVAHAQRHERECVALRRRGQVAASARSIAGVTANPGEYVCDLTGGFLVQAVEPESNLAQRFGCALKQPAPRGGDGDDD